MKYFSYVLMLALLFPVLAAAAESQEPKADPFELWRKPDTPAPAQVGGPQIASPAPAVPAPSPAPAPSSSLPASFSNALVVQDKPVNPEPMEDYTQYYQRKQYVVDNGMEKHALTYFWKEPKALSPRKKYPLVLILHDERGVANAGEVLVLDEVQHDFPAFLAVPALSANQNWSFPAKFPEDLPLAGAQGKLKQMLPDTVRMIKDLARDNPVDTKRIYVVGCGEGGFGAFGAALHDPDLFAAAVPMSGGWAVKESSKLTKIPLFVMHGDADKTYQPAWSRDVAYWVQNFNGNVHYVAVPGLGHDCSDKRLYSKAVWTWLSEQHK